MLIEDTSRLKSLGERLEAQKKQKAEGKRLLAIYDLLGQGYSHDVCIFLVAAERMRREGGYSKIDIALVAHSADPGSPAAPYVNNENFRHYIHNLMVEACRLLSTVGNIFLFDDRNFFDTFLVSNNLRYQLFPEDYSEKISDRTRDNLASLVVRWTRQIEQGVRSDKSLFCLYPPVEQVNLVRKWILRNVYPKIPVSITLREVEWRSTVNNQLEQWQHLIDSHKESEVLFIVLRDYYKIYEDPPLKGENVIYYNEPLTTLSVRAALYQECRLNLFVPNGCAVIAMFNNRCNYIYFATQCVGLSMDGCYETNPYQKIIYQEDSLEVLKTHLDTLLKKLEGNNELIPGYYDDLSVANNVRNTSDTFKKSNSERQKYLHQYTPDYLCNKIAKLSDDWKESNIKVLIYGAGYHTTNLFELAQLGKRNVNIVGIADSDPATHGEERFGYKIISPDKISVIGPDVILISSNAYQDEIYNSLAYYERSGIKLVKLYS